MKRIISLVVMTLMMTVSVMAMSTSNIRTNARFLSDRMAYELDLTPSQYDDCYEINYDFIYNVSYIMSDVVRGYTDAINMYYQYLDYRNEDLRYVLSATQYNRFMNLEYFYRPIYSTGRDWAFRIYTIYSNRTFYYYDAPSMYRCYAGEHGRRNYANGYYNNRHNDVNHYTGTDHRMVGGNNMANARRGDFGTNLKERNNPTQNRQNDYNNKNEKNRTQNQNYRDNSNNKNAPSINNRNGMSGDMQNGQQRQQNTNQQGNMQQNSQSRNQQSGMQQNNQNRNQGNTQQNNNSRTNNNNGSANKGNVQNGRR